MGKGFYDLVRDLLLKYKCEFVRQGKGSHEIWQSPITNKRFSVPVTVESKHTANGILRQAGISEKL
ncbi:MULTISPECIES: type II toxin-antitoxin system HicA family toxin [Acinetobacter]|uniref:Type II toxin-antitoxin system HicA family toxin n=1 Tax=Acinetobacter indicus TaxID=756892 RepID=A0A6C0Y0T0_9GAMM|nr:MULTISPECIES: type II toxin-antitoxin system HicA family toxin [Acinetobacter]MCK4097396.1 type II toxin-antitoxin system HicA family toxin [Acinetobacter radioresistens]MDH0836896.1 type II toxin-antitoxin system HicA family toxin [Acinetobacter johnsonii]MDH0840111.1 type II toxin-antitoxin system HicA family toxin [Acinetobacter johnsonii]QIC69814.1 type II toxin-antitoxin system HicA family toxin [Acinetobacter indicus]